MPSEMRCEQGIGVYRPQQRRKRRTLSRDDNSPSPSLINDHPLFHLAFGEQDMLLDWRIPKFPGKRTQRISWRNGRIQIPKLERTDRIVFTESQLFRQSWTSCSVEESSQSGRNELDQDGSGKGEKGIRNKFSLTATAR